MVAEFVPETGGKKFLYPVHQNPLVIVSSCIVRDTFQSLGEKVKRIEIGEIKCA